MRKDPEINLNLDEKQSPREIVEELLGQVMDIAGENGFDFLAIINTNNLDLIAIGDSYKIIGLLKIAEKAMLEEANSSWIDD